MCRVKDRVAIVTGGGMGIGLAIAVKLGNEGAKVAIIDQDSVHLKKALMEIERVGKKGYLMVESYRNEEELFNLQCWALTAEAFFDYNEWCWIFDEFGYSGDFEFIYFV